MLPDGWKIQVVGALFEVQLGKMLNKAAKEKEPQVRYLTNFNVRWGSFDTSRLNTMYFSEREQEKFSLKSGDIIMCEGGDVGRCAIWLGTDFPCYYQKALHRLRTKGDILPEYFQAYMTSIAGSKLLDDYTSRTSIAHLTREKLVELPVKVPPLPEQKKIAQILSTWDNAISATERLLENSQQRKKALMQQLLTGKKRLPGFEGEWSLKSIGSISSILKGKGLNKSLLGDTGVPCIHYGELFTSFGAIANSPRSLTSEVPDSPVLSQSGDVLMPTSDVTPNGLAKATCIKQKGCVLGGDILVIRTHKDTVLGDFLSYLLNYSKRKILSIALGTTVFHIYGKDMSLLKFKFPDVKEQQAIANVLTTADQEIDALQKRLDHLKQEKKALMQQLLTGKRRVQVEDVA